jgi:FecR protein
MQKRNFLLFSLVISTVILGVCAAPAGAAASAATGAPGGDSVSYVRIVRLSYVSGDVQIVRADQSDKWQAAYANMPIQQGFTLGTNNGRAEVEFESGSALWLAEKSMLQFTELALSDGGRVTKVTLLEGTATFEADLRAGDSFVVSTTKFEITPKPKSRFRVDAFSDGGSVSMLAGGASISSASGAKDLGRGETFALGSGDELETVRANPVRDSWDKWVSDRANYLNTGAGETLQYTNSPFGYGMADLSAYGNWMTSPGCGYGWQPYAGASWTPFYNGQWLYYPSFGWSWVSYEPWGWTPYHFGSWINCPGNGWLWQPGGYGNWIGAPVQWVQVGGRSGRRIGWQPRPIHPPMRPGHADSQAGLVVASKSLGKEGKYEVLPPAKMGGEIAELPRSPLSDGKIPPPGAVETHGGGGANGSASGRVIVPTSANLVALRNQLAEGGGGGALCTTSKPGAPTPTATSLRPLMPTSEPVASLQNAAPHPAPRTPPTPPVRTYVAPPSNPGQPSYRPAPQPTSGWNSNSSGRSAPSSPSFSGGRSAPSPASAPSSAPAPAAAPHPH